MDVRGVVVSLSTDTGPSHCAEIATKAIVPRRCFNDLPDAVHDPLAKLLHFRNRPVKQVIAGTPSADIAFSLTGISLNGFQNHSGQVRVDRLGLRKSKSPDRSRKK